MIITPKSNVIHPRTPDPPWGVKSAVTILTDFQKRPWEREACSGVGRGERRPPLFFWERDASVIFN